MLRWIFPLTLPSLGKQLSVIPPSELEYLHSRAPSVTLMLFSLLISPSSCPCMTLTWRNSSATVWKLTLSRLHQVGHLNGRQYRQMCNMNGLLFKMLISLSTNQFNSDGINVAESCFMPSGKISSKIAAQLKLILSN